MCVLAFSPPLFTPLFTPLFEGKPSHPICDTVSQVEQNLPLVHITIQQKRCDKLTSEMSMWLKLN